MTAGETTGEPTAAERGGAAGIGRDRSARFDGALDAGPHEDPVDFAEWVRPHLSSMAHLVARLTPEADRDDVVQEALVRAWSKRHQFNPAKGTPGAWLVAIAADQAGKARRRTRLHLPFGEESVVAPVEAKTAGRVDIEKALTRLSRRQRIAVECYYFVGLTVAETAAVMRCAEGTVKSTLADARARLRTLLEDS